MSKDEGRVQFNGNNYMVWRSEVRAALVGKEVWHAVISPNVLLARMVDREATDEKFNAAHSEWAAKYSVWADLKGKENKEKPFTEPKPVEPLKENFQVIKQIQVTVTVFDPIVDGEAKTVTNFRSDMSKAYGILMRSLKPSFKIAVQNCVTAKDVWDYFETTYNTKTQISKVLTCRDAFHATMKPGTPLKNHLAWFDQKISEVVMCGYNLQEEVLAILLLLSLPPEFSHCVAALESTHLSTPLTISEVKVAALQDEARRMGANAAFVEGAMRAGGDRGQRRGKGRDD